MFGLKLTRRVKYGEWWSVESGSRNRRRLVLVDKKYIQSQSRVCGCSNQDWMVIFRMSSFLVVKSSDDGKEPGERSSKVKNQDWSWNDSPARRLTATTVVTTTISARACVQHYYRHADEPRVATPSRMLTLRSINYLVSYDLRRSIRDGVTVQVFGYRLPSYRCRQMPIGEGFLEKGFCDQQVG